LIKLPKMEVKKDIMGVMNGEKTDEIPACQEKMWCRAEGFRE